MQNDSTSVAYVELAISKLLWTGLLRSDSLPIGLNRISWKRWIFPLYHGMKASKALPIGLNRISWKRKGTG
jgi:hypothetical protein